MSKVHILFQNTKSFKRNLFLIYCRKLYYKMKKQLFFPILIIFLASCGTSPMKKMDWLQGNWETKGKNAGYHEIWQLDSGIYKGNSYALKKNDTIYAEKMLIQKEGDEIIFRAANNKEDKTAFNFKLDEVNNNQIIFINPLNDYPKKIIYEKLSDTSLVVKVSGIHDGKDVSNKTLMYKYN